MIKAVKTGGRFPRRILLVDTDEALVLRCSDILQSEGFEVITARNGFEALHVLRGARPDVLVTELNLPHMSGFELLSVVRKRFPLISVIATSGEYTPITVPRKAICDAFIAKNENFFPELLNEARALITESPLRGMQPKAAVAPVWIPHSAAGYIILTCPECLRSFSVSEPPSACTHEEVCVYCGTKVSFRMSALGGTATTMQQRSITARTQSEKLRTRSRKLRGKARR